VTLERYRQKRRFRVTPEPRGRRARAKGDAYVIQKHDATRLHYDLRLEMDGVLKSWAVPKGPSLDPGEKRLAVEVEDHPLEYGGFEGRIPEGEYGAGQVIVWDTGTWEPLEDAHEGFRRGRLKFVIHGEKLGGAWMLVRMGGRAAEERRPNWLLIKERDAFARPAAQGDILEERPESVSSGATLDRDARGKNDGPARERHRRGARTKADRGAKLPDPATIEGARRAALPRTLAPQLATLVKAPVEGDAWLHEIKFDGYRMLARFERGRVRMFTRTGQDWTERFAAIAEAVSELPCRDAVLDGEVVVLEPDGTSDFQALQNALRRRDDAELVYYVFDLLHLDGFDTTAAPLESRKRLLEALVDTLPRGTPVRYSAHVAGKGEAFFDEACRRHLEGVISKRRDAPYHSARTRDWLKVKCGRRQEFVIGGYTDPSGARAGLGALLVGVHDERGALRYAGKVGTGFDHDTLVDLERRLRGLARQDSPFADAPRGRTMHWVDPKLVCEVVFTEWTADGRLRHPSFQGLREDKPAKSVRRETPAAPRAGTRAGDVESAREPGMAERARPRGRHRTTGGRPTPERVPARGAARSDQAPRVPTRSAAARDVVAGVRISHPDRVLYPDVGLTKIDVARYFEAVAPFMLHEIADRPLMLKRCPGGQAGPCFFQKHPATTLPSPPLVPVRITERTKTETYLTLHDIEGLVSLVQFGVLEMHVWGCRRDRIEQPDRMVFDLDPGPRVEWSRVPALARRLRERLDALDLPSFVKTTGGKGLHIVVPLQPSAGWGEMIEFSNAIARQLVDDDPTRLTMRMAKAGRENKILIDTLRNGRGATWVGAWSTRARPGAPVSMPITWDEVKTSLRPDGFTVGGLERRLARAGDPWSDIDRARRRITRAMWKTLGASAPARGAAD
jgi:bifunctional non-homologous end joining protein LigD